eukprot:3657034-Alexandrium_andersonii.AAC.1
MLSLATPDARRRRAPLVVAHPSPSEGPLAGAGNALGDRQDIPRTPGPREPDLLGAGRRDQLRPQSCPRD